MRKGHEHSRSESLSNDERVETFLQEMTLDEKIGQLTLYSSDRDTTGPIVRPEYKDEIKAGRVGAIFNAYTAAFTRELQEMAVEPAEVIRPRKDDEVRADWPASSFS